MKVNHVANKTKFLKDNLPTLEEKVDALIEGGPALAAIKQKIASVKARANKN